MLRHLLAAGLVLAIAGTLGCTGVQKGAAAGGAVGSGTGAVVGHATAVGSGAGAIVGFGVGAVGGAIAGEHYYGSDDEELGAASDTIDRLTQELEAREARLSDMSSSIEQEKAQQTALLEAYDKLRGQQQVLSATTTVEPEKTDGEIKYTLVAGVLFNSGSAKLSSSGKAALKRTAQSIRARYPDAGIEVRGHTDNVPIKYSSYKSNLVLSQARARAVVDYLVKTERLDRARFTTTGYGDTRPVASNKSSTGRGKNRRAEIVMLPRRVQMAAADPGR